MGGFIAFSLIKLSESVGLHLSEAFVTIVFESDGGQQTKYIRHTGALFLGPRSHSG